MEKAIDHSHSSFKFRLFRVFFLCFALVSSLTSISLHLSSLLPLFSLLVLSALLLFNYIHKKSALSDEILLQEANQKPENETVVQEYAADEYDFTMSNDFELRSSSISCENSLFSILSDDESSTEVDDEDYLIEIPLPEQVTSLKQGKKKLDTDELLDLLPESLLEQEGLAQLLSEINGEDNLIEIDVSVGSIRC
ncbi:Hypothetical predicted protein [Olea europaea subsp. europaea]|uniref:Transmembrane protein n=1 Tax=Olea europaea subsp. europaea TaxID=158383 RepID=A0A8S0URJ1_OLEEU|nr:Hypothetical predicted protein [Olea europaea subsp. europaea]